MSASVGTALPIARATLAAPVAGHRDDDLQGDGPLPTPPLTPTSVPGMPLATSLAPDLRDPLESLASPRPLPRSNTPAHQDVRRSIEISDVPRSSPLLLFRDSAPAPLPVESIAAPARGRAPGNRASSGLDETPAFFAPAPVDLPLATGAVTAYAGGTSASSGTGSPGLQRLAVNGQSLGAAPRPANIVWRAPDSEPISEAPTEAAPAQAVGQITATASQKPAEPDLDKLTEKVWQRIRRTLQLERERQKGLP